MTARKVRGLDLLRDAAVEAASGIPVLSIDEVPAVLLTPREVSRVTRLPYRYVLDAIRAGRIRVVKDGNREYVIPVSELAEIVSWADYLGPTAS